MGAYEWLTVFTAIGGVLIAGGGLIVSIASLNRSKAVKKQQLRLQEKQEELVDIQLQLHRREAESVIGSSSQSTTADVRISLEGSARDARFVVRNWGFGAALNVDMEVNSLEGRECPRVNGDGGQKLPITRLGPGSEFRLIAALTLKTGTTFDVTWTWEEEDGTRREQSSCISL